MSKLEAFLEKIPDLIGAVQPEQLRFFLLKAFECEMTEETTAFAEGDPLDRLTILAVWPCQDSATRQYVLNLLRLRMVSHGVHEHGRDEWEILRVRLAELLRGEESFNATVAVVFSVDDALESEWA